MANTMMKLRDFTFSVDTAAYNELQRSATWRWSKTDVAAGLPARQFIGPDTDTVSVRGTIPPHFKGGLEQVDRLRELADRGTPMQLVTGTGEAAGRFIVTSCQETQRVFSVQGQPLHIEFDLALERYDFDSTAFEQAEV